MCEKYLRTVVPGRTACTLPCLGGAGAEHSTAWQRGRAEPRDQRPPAPHSADLRQSAV